MLPPRQTDSHAALALRQIRHVLDQDFSHLIDMTDHKRKNPEERQKALRSRSLAALVVRGLVGLSNEEAARCVIDGRNDYGIDAIAVSEESSKIWLVQSKWSGQGRASLNQGDALKFLRGWHLIENREFDRFNERIRGMANQINSVLHRQQAQVHFVVALTGPDELHPDVVGVFDDVFDETNVFGLTLDLQVLGMFSLWDQVRAEQVSKGTPITATLHPWIHVKKPMEMYQGIVSAAQIATWVEEAGEALFHRNIRTSLGMTEASVGILETLTSNPEYFLFFHNGITIICESITPTFPGPRRPSKPVMLTMRGASVVNGAQSVNMLNRAMLKSPDALSQAGISVHIICIDKSSELNVRITEARNRQNPVMARDFIALDETQALIREDFGVLGKSYNYKRGEPDPTPEEGCSVVEAAIALACLHPNVKLVIRAKQHVDTLWERGPEGAYPMLFGGQPSASQIWGAVQLRRAVGTRLHQIGKELRGRGSDVAEHGDLIITHLVFQCVDHKGMDSEEYDWDKALSKTDDLVNIVLPWFLYHMDAEYGPDSKSSLIRTLSDPSRCQELIALVLRDIQACQPVPAVSDEYQLTEGQQERRFRRPNSVTLLCNAGALNSGTELEFHPASVYEKQALSPWLMEDPSRAQATWTNNRKKPLLWAFDGNFYSPSGLVKQMHELAAWAHAPLAVQGAKQWFIGGESLADRAQKVLSEMGERE